MQMLKKYKSKHSLVIDKAFRQMGNIILNHSMVSVIIFYNTVILIASETLYKLIPYLMCYGEDMQQSSSAVNFSYNYQFASGTLAIIVVSTAILTVLFKDIDKYKGLSINNEEEYKKLKSIRKKCMNLPYIIYICQISVPIFIVILISIVARVQYDFPVIIILRLLSVVFCCSFFCGVAEYVFSKWVFTKILYNTYTDSKPEGFRVSIAKKMLLQVIPMIITGILITALLGYSRLIEEKGNLLQELYRSQMSDRLKKTMRLDEPMDVFQKLQSIEVDSITTKCFLVSPNKKIITEDGIKLPEYYNYSINNPINGYKIYGFTKETQGVVQKVNIEGKYWIAGILFDVESAGAEKTLLTALIVLILVNVFITYCFSKSICSDISHVADTLMEITQGGCIEDRKYIAVISNDEIGDLIIAFNKIQQLEEEYDQMKNEFFANVSHELHTPLNVILSSVQLLVSMNKGHHFRGNIKGVDKVSEMIKQNTYRLLRLVNNLIDSSKINASFYDIHMKNNDIVNIVEEISLAAAVFIKERNINFLFDTDVEECIMACDADMIERIILNILSNAIKFTGSGGEIFVNMHKEDSNIIISIKDSGIGMSEEQQKLIFERFKQVDKSFTREREGSGIGLSLVKLLVELHKGSVSVKSQLNLGSEFTVIFPIILNDQFDENYEKRLICYEKVNDCIEKIKIEFSDIY